MSHIRTMFSAQASKAIVAGVVATIGAATTALTIHNGTLTPLDILTIIGTGIGAWQGTYWTTNADDPTAPTQLASATPIHDAMVAEYTATPVEPQP